MCRDAKKLLPRSTGEEGGAKTAVWVEIAILAIQKWEIWSFTF